MADLAEMLKGILDDPGTADKLRSLIGDTPSQKPTVPDPPDSIDPAMMIKLTRAIKQMNGKKNDNRTRLLYDLKPYISKERGKRVDEAIEILRLIWVLDIFKDDFKGDVQHDE